MGRIFRRDEELLGGDRETRPRATFEPVERQEQLDALFDMSGRRSTLLFLHDPFCPISSMAYEEVEQLDIQVELVDVSQHSALGRTVEARTGIRHESPQAIVLRGGVPVWHASHGRIRADAIREALDVG